ncbi:MAG: hypothetical protein GY853_13900 [PVC group bacterium]|nr:hypothetical protein [PVC group bacterium]
MPTKDLCEAHHQKLLGIDKKIDVQIAKFDEINTILCGGPDKEGRFQVGFLSKLKWVEKKQAIITGVFISVITAVVIAGILYVPTLIKAAEIVGK